MQAIETFLSCSLHYDATASATRSSVTVARESWSFVRVNSAVGRGFGRSHGGDVEAILQAICLGLEAVWVCKELSGSGL